MRVLSSHEVKEGLAARGCVYPNGTGNQFIGTGGDHLTGYCNVDPALTGLEYTEELAESLASPLLDTAIDTFVTAATAGIPVAYLVARAYMQVTGRDIRMAWADKVEPEGLALSRGNFSNVVCQRRVAIVEEFI